jgi:hypothetical protein
MTPATVRRARGAAIVRKRKDELPHAAIFVRAAAVSFEALIDQAFIDQAFIDLPVSQT